ncbi:hypothetical protein E3N88_22302 [Mikania micrantha]|uniref:Uncharacterized protein n=1 Tax=Mikania micrantha TaxID=192012 RepID=A0A5N6NA38_9ASTR|nr:hypothetical protein E3N88_22302 [Mikania micrantha]
MEIGLYNHHPTLILPVVGNRSIGVAIVLATFLSLWLDLEKDGHKPFKVWDLSTCSMPIKVRFLLLIDTLARKHGVGKEDELQWQHLSYNQLFLLLSRTVSNSEKLVQFDEQVMVISFFMLVRRVQENQSTIQRHRKSDNIGYSTSSSPSTATHRRAATVTSSELNRHAVM